MTFRVLTFSGGLIDEQIVTAPSLADVATTYPAAMAVVNADVEENALEAGSEAFDDAISELTIPLPA